MSRIRGLSEENAQRELAKLKKLLKINKELKTRVPQNDLEESILPIQIRAVKDKIYEIVTYLGRWNVPIRIQDED